MSMKRFLRIPIKKYRWTGLTDVLDLIVVLEVLPLPVFGVAIDVTSGFNVGASVQEESVWSDGHFLSQDHIFISPRVILGKKPRRLIIAAHNTH